MSELAVWQRTIVDEEGNIVPLAEVEVRHEHDDSLATIYADRDGDTELDNPLTADTAGFARFYAEGGAYKVTATGAGSEISWRFVPVGLLAERDKPAFDSVADVENSRIHKRITAIRTNGYYEPGDGGGALYVEGDEGPGAIQSGDGRWWELVGRGRSYTIYVDSATGADDNNGLSSGAALQTIQAAVDLAGRLRFGDPTIQISAGTYNEEVRVNRVQSDRPIVIKGPSVGGHPNVPTCVISGAGIESSNAFRLSRYSEVSIQDVKVTGFTSGNAVNNDTFSKVSLINFHTENTRTAVANLHHAFVSVSGGVWDGNNIEGGVGYRSFYNATHSMTQASNDAAADALTIKNFDRGLLINEGVQGHIDNINILNCKTGINNKRGAGAINSSGVKIDGCDVGILNENNAWFENSVQFGTISQNSVNVRNVGSSPELSYLTNINNSKTKRVVEQSNVASHTGTTSNTDLYTTGPSPRWGLMEGGDIAEIVIYGNCELTEDCIIQIVMDNDGDLDLLANATVPAGASHFMVRFTLRHSSALTVRAFSELLSDLGSAGSYRETTNLSLGNGGFKYTLRANLGSALDSIRLASIIYSNTYGG